MKKVAVFVLILLIIIASIFGFHLYSTSNKPEDTENLALREEILNNSSWITLNKEDFNGYLNGTYTPAVLSIIDSLENATPVIFQITGNKFSNIDDGIFIVASAFNAKNQVYVYYYNPETNNYQKTEASLEYILEDSVSALIYNLTEGLE